MRYNFNEFIKSNDIKGLCINLLYLYKYNRIDRSIISDHLQLFNEINGTTYKIETLQENKLKIIDNNNNFVEMEL